MSEDVEDAPEPLNPYDEVPYRGNTIPLAHPDRLAVAALRRGMEPAPTQRARVLELGCAEGGNIVPLAFHFDEAQLVGVDGSRVQIEEAQETRDRLGLDNLELRHADFLALGPEDLGTFDYILCHGVFSWVDAPVRDKILAIARDHLAPQGVLYLSYNCRPGWAMRSLMRRALMERVRGIEDPRERIKRVRQLLAWMADTPLKHNAWGRNLAEEASAVWTHRDEYLVHEYLSPENRPFHFREIVELASAHGLKFLSELSRATTDPRVEEAMRESFVGAVDDWVEVEELSELFLFRAFRCSLFVKDEVELGDMHPELGDRVRFAGEIEPESKRVSLDPGVHEFFRIRNARISAEDPILKGALLELARWWPRALSFAQIEERVRALLQVRRVHGPDDPPAPERFAALKNDLLELGRLNYLHLRLHEPEVAAEAGPRPRVSAMTRLGVEKAAWATTPHHRVVPFDAFTRLLIRYLDGARGLDELIEKMRAHAEAGDVKLTLEDGSPLEPEELEVALPKLIDASVQALAVQGLLV